MTRVLSICYSVDMRNLLFVSGILSLFLFVFLFFGQATFAQDAALSQRWVCLNAVQCSKSGAGCSGKGVLVHRALLTTGDVKVLPNVDTYIFECVATSQGQVCTTGNPTADAAVFGSTNSPLHTLQTTSKYKFEGLYGQDGVSTVANPTQTSNGVLGPLEWQSASVDTARKFVAMNYFNPNTALQGNAGGQQQGTFDFDTAQKNCVSIHWDPFGRVFDSQSFEPVSGAAVTLYKQQADGQFTVLSPSDVVGSAITNPYYTLDDGEFNFVVPDGTYRLDVAKDGYIFASQIAQTRGFGPRMYSDIYPAKTGQDIVQKGAIVHRDIPIDSKTVPTSNRISMMEYFYEINKLTGQLVIDGRASQPYAIAKAYAVSLNLPSTPSATPVSQLPISLGSVTAGADGRFHLSIPVQQIPEGYTFGTLQLIKGNLLSLAHPKTILDMVWNKIAQLIIPDTYAQQDTTTISFNPIPNYLEGFAYDNQGHTLPGATVGVYLSFSDKPYVTVTADKTGYFRIGSEKLPNMPYSLRYTLPSGTSISLSTTAFTKENAQYFEKNNINLAQAKSTAVLVTTKSPNEAPASNPAFFMQSPLGQISTAPSGSQPTQNNQSATAQTTNPGNVMLMIIAVIALLVSITVLVVFGLRKRKTVETPPLP